MIEPRIYVACLAAYNSGKLHGAWINAAQDVEDIHEEIAQIIKTSPVRGEEWAIHDHEGFGPASPGEYESLATVAAIARGIEEHGDAFAAFVGDVLGVHYIGDDVEEKFSEAYSGSYDSVKEFACRLVDDGLFGPIPEAIASYIDYDAIARDLFCGDYSAVQVGSVVHVFRSI